MDTTEANSRKRRTIVRTMSTSSASSTEVGSSRRMMGPWRRSATERTFAISTTCRSANDNDATCAVAGIFKSSLASWAVANSLSLPQLVDAVPERLVLVSEHDVFGDAQVRKNRLLLKHHPDPDIVRGGDAAQCDALAAKHNLPAVRTIKTGEYLQRIEFPPTFSPTRPKISHERISTETASRARVSPKVLVKFSVRNTAVVT